MHTTKTVDGLQFAQGSRGLIALRSPLGSTGASSHRRLCLVTACHMANARASSLLLRILVHGSANYVGFGRVGLRRRSLHLAMRLPQGRQAVASCTSPSFYLVQVSAGHAYALTLYGLTPRPDVIFSQLGSVLDVASGSSTNADQEGTHLSIGFPGKMAWQTPSDITSEHSGPTSGSTHTASALL